MSDAEENIIKTTVASDLDSDDEDFASKLASKMNAPKVDGAGDDMDDDSQNDTDSDSDDEDSDSDSDTSEDDGKSSGRGMDTDVGFEWGGQASAPGLPTNDSSESDNSDSSDDDSDEDEDIDKAGRSSHKSRKKEVAKRREEKNTSFRETALADGTADENPETSADFERLLAGDPNSSENWIKYMAFHLSLADIDSARNVANRAFERIEFRQETEKLNVWTALLTLEFKYGTSKSLGQTIDRACQQNNPKQVYLRVCEMLEKEVEATSSNNSMNQAHTDAVARADEMFSKMCKKFRSKKTVWIAHLKYLLKGGRHDEANALLKRALVSLPQYKHVESMSKFAELEYEHGSIERGRTIFSTLAEKNRKRLDLVLRHIDKEVKHGELEAARSIFESVVTPSDNNMKLRYSDKQMKSLFKKWYRIEEIHGDHTSREHVKSAAKTFVEGSTK